MKYTLAEHVSLTEVDDEAVLLNLSSGAYYGLNHVGAMLMNRLQNRECMSSAIEAIAKHYQMPIATVTQDVELLVKQLSEQQLLKEL